MGYANTQDLTNNNTTYIRDQKQTLDSLMRSNSSESSTFNNIGANVNYRGKLDSLGRELTFDADYARFRNTIHRNFSNTLYNPDNEKLGNTDFIRNYFPTSVDIYALKTDLVFPLAHKAKIEAGAKSSWVTTDNDAQYDSLLENKWVPSLTQSNHFIYKENINAAYVNFRKDWGKMNIQGGLRMEQTNTDGNLLTLQSRTERHYLNFFPSAFVSRKLNDDNTFMASYSRRIERPSYQDLNPFKFYADRYTYSEGNPFLQPAYTNSFEFTHSWKDQLVTVFRYGVTHNVITEDIQQDPNTNVTKSLLINLDQLTNFSLSLSYTKDLTSWWSTDNTITLNRSEYSDNKSGNARDFHNYDFNINIYNSFRLTKSLSADLGGFYLSPWLYGFIKAQAQYKVDVGLKQNLWGKKASLKLKLSDVFATNRFRGTAVYDNNVRVYIDNRFESRIVFLTFTWLFGNSKLKVAKHNEGNSDEKSRVKTTAQ
jgi:outer membrane receptor protein involved in Fe transport